MEALPEKPIRKPPVLGAALFGSLAGAFGALLLFSWLAQDVIASQSRSFDLNARLWIHQHANPALTEAMKIITTLGSFAFLGVLFVLLAVLFFALNWRRAVAWLALSTAGAIVLNDSL